VRDTVVQGEEELRARLEAGARLARDRWGFKLYDPKTNRWERVSVKLNEVAAGLYVQQRRRKALEKVLESLEGRREAALELIREVEETARGGGAGEASALYERLEELLFEALLLVRALRRL
jgi:hypothetical protein